MEPNWLSPREDRAWRAFMHAHHQLGVHLNRGLQESGLSGADYEILAVLSGHDGDRMPAHELCNTLGWEKSRVSHQVRRMQKDGLISREPNPDDARSTMVCLLPAGRAAIEKAAPRHVADVRRNFIDLLTPAEVDMLAALNERVLRHLGRRRRLPRQRRALIAFMGVPPTAAQPKRTHDDAGGLRRLMLRQKSVELQRRLTRIAGYFDKTSACRAEVCHSLHKTLSERFFHCLVRRSGSLVPIAPEMARLGHVVEKSTTGAAMATRVGNAATGPLCDFVHQCPGREVAVTGVVNMSLLGAEQVVQPNAAVENQVDVVSGEHDERAPGRVHRRRTENPQWYRNLLAHPDVHIQIGPDRRAVRAVVASSGERARLWPRLVDAYADFDSYQSATEREIPVIILQPR